MGQNSVPSSYDLGALKKDHKKVEEEIKVFNDMLQKLMKRKIELEMMIDSVQERDNHKE